MPILKLQVVWKNRYLQSPQRNGLKETTAKTPRSINPLRFDLPIRALLHCGHRCILNSLQTNYRRSRSAPSVKYAKYANSPTISVGNITPMMAKIIFMSRSQDWVISRRQVTSERHAIQCFADSAPSQTAWGPRRVRPGANRLINYESRPSLPHAARASGRSGPSSQAVCTV